jgi:hypothetical protein
MTTACFYDPWGSPSTRASAVYYAFFTALSIALISIYDHAARRAPSVRASISPSIGFAIWFFFMYALL